MDLGETGGPREWWRITHVSDDLIDLANKSFWEYEGKLYDAIPVAYNGEPLTDIELRS